MKKHPLFTALAVSAVLLTSGMAVHAAQNHDTHKAKSAKTETARESALSAEQQATMKAIMDDFDGRMVPLQEQMYAKSLELKALSKNPNTTQDTIAALSKEIASLKTQIRKEMTARNDKLEKEIGAPMKRGGKKDASHTMNHCDGGCSKF